ncbi:MAG TPA: FAD:protein FMN transferase [Longimicrobiales bacterium]|nr:FAD:protein FMN transferase [Longimicrobiales bacterium]
MAVTIAGLLPAGVHAQGTVEARAETTRTGYLMGTRFRVELPAGVERRRALAASEAAVAALEGMESLLSTWRDDTPLSALNRAPAGVPHAVAPLLLPLLDEALAWSARTGGAFDPRVGPLVEAWDLRGGGRVPSAEELDRARSAVGDRGITLCGGMLIRHHPDAWLDTGGFGKGAALASAARALRSMDVDDALLDLGGQLLALGSPHGGEGWAVSVAHPLHRDIPVRALRLRDASVATSGNSQRSLQAGGTRVGHLLDPRTGRPAADWGSVTVVSADPLEADILSTALYVLGPEAGMALALTLPDTGVLFLTPSGEGVDARWNPAMERWLVAPHPTGAVDLSNPTPTGNDP